MGVLTKDKFEGEVVDEWKTALNKCDPKPEEVDISAAVGSILSIKDDEEAVSDCTIHETLDLEDKRSNSLNFCREPSRSLRR
jgi:nucleosome binding factor SPN SPT16 subunit